MNPDEQAAPEQVAESVAPPVSIEHETTFDSPLTIGQLGWIGAGLLGVLLLLTLRDAWLAKKKWVVPFLLILRVVACAGVLLALAAPAKTTRRTFESRHGLGIYLDTSASMGLRDPADGKGHLARWRLATGNRNQRSVLAEIDEASARVEVALVLATSSDRGPETRGTLNLLGEQLRSASGTLNEIAPRLPYPGLIEEVHEAFQTANSKTIESLLKDLASDGSPTGGSRAYQKRLDVLRHDVDEALKRLAVISRELARRAESIENRSGSPAGDPTRLEWAKALLQRVEEEILSPAENELEVGRNQFTDRVGAADREWNVSADSFPGENPNGDDPIVVGSPDRPASPLSTDLSSALAEIAAQQRHGRIDAAVLVTDGVHNAEGNPLVIPPELKDFPLFLVPSGGDYKLDDITLWRAAAPDTLVQGDFLSVDCLVGARGFAGKTTRLRLLEGDKELDGVDVTFDENGGDHEFRLTAKVDSAGSRRFEIELASLPGELHTENNRESINVNVFTGDLKILLVDGWPRWETRYLSNLLKRDDTTKHEEILFAPDPPDPIPNTLTSGKELSAFDIVVLGEVGPDFLGPVEIAALENFVNEGGNLIVIAGNESMPADYLGTKFAEILPVRLDVQRRQVVGEANILPTAAGRRIAALNLEDATEQNAAVWRLGSSLLPMTELSPFNVPKPAAQVILEVRPADVGGTALPFIAWHRYGGGRVFYFPSPTTYHLRYRFGDRYHYRFWGQFLRWATMAEMHGGNALIQISTSAKRYAENEAPRVDIEVLDLEGRPVTGAQIGIQLERVGAAMTEHASAEVAGKPGFYTAVLPPLSHGDYRIRATGPAVDALLAEIENDGGEEIPPGESGFVVEARPSREAGNRTCDWETLQRLADSTGGALIPPDALAAAIDVLAREGAKSRREEITRTPVWDRWSLFFLILIFLTVEWIGRKYAGLI